MSVDEPGRWMRLDPLDKIREEGDDGDGGTGAASGGAPLPSPPLSLGGTMEDETVYGRCSKRERPSIRKSEKHDSIM